jgi:hypothetical protein
MRFAKAAIRSGVISARVAARIDILARDPNGVLYGLEVKTGNDPTFTPGQRVVYPHAIGGAGVMSFDPRI